MPKKDPSPWLPGLTKSIHLLPSTKPQSANCTINKAAAQRKHFRGCGMQQVFEQQNGNLSVTLPGEVEGRAHSRGSGGCCWPRPCRHRTTPGD